MIILQGVYFTCSGVPIWRSKPRRGLRQDQDIHYQLEESQERAETTVQTYFVSTWTIMIHTCLMVRKHGVMIVEIRNGES